VSQTEGDQLLQKDRSGRVDLDNPASFLCQELVDSIQRCEPGESLRKLFVMDVSLKDYYVRTWSG
jgi:hypothetical protein